MKIDNKSFGTITGDLIDLYSFASAINLKGLHAK